MMVFGPILNLNFRTDLQMFATELRDKCRNYKINFAIIEVKVFLKYLQFAFQCLKVLR